jgi:hypothetical protein
MKAGGVGQILYLPQFRGSGASDDNICTKREIMTMNKDSMLRKELSVHAYDQRGRLLKGTHAYGR